MPHHHFSKPHCSNDDVILSNTYGHQPLPLSRYVPGLRNSIIIELGIGFIIAFSNSIGIGIEIGIEKKARPVLLLVLVLQFTLSQYWY